jgi:hypothetical protein
MAIAPRVRKTRTVGEDKSIQAATADAIRQSTQLEGEREKFFKEESDKILSLFRKTNIYTLIFVGYAYSVDVVLMLGHYIEPKDRLISANVILGLIAGSVTQLGALVLVIGKALPWVRAPRAEGVK